MIDDTHCLTQAVYDDRKANLQSWWLASQVYGTCLAWSFCLFSTSSSLQLWWVFWSMHIQQQMARPWITLLAAWAFHHSYLWSLRFSKWVSWAVLDSKFEAWIRGTHNSNTCVIQCYLWVQVGTVPEWWTAQLAWCIWCLYSWCWRLVYMFIVSL